MSRIKLRTMGAITFFVIVAVLAGCTAAPVTPSPSPTLTPTPTPTPSPSPSPSPTPHYTISIVNDPSIGTYLVDANGFALYWTTLDSSGRSNISGDALVTFPVFYVANVSVPAALSGSDIGTITRADSSMQTTYKGSPLYYYSGDKSPGDTTGDGFDGVWSVAVTGASAPVVQAAEIEK